MNVVDFKIIHPRPAPVTGTVTPPGDKSVSHRIAMMAALATGDSMVDGFLTSGDCLNTLAAVQALGAGVIRADAQVKISGTGGRFRAPASSLLDMGNSGTAMRLIAGLLAAHDFDTELTGDASLLSRPMKRIRVPLEAMGAKLTLLGNNECGPVRIRGSRLKAVDYVLPMASAQVKSCVLLAGLFADGVTSVTEPAPTRDHTERLFRAMEIPLAIDGGRVSITGSASAPLSIRPRNWVVPGDFSSAAFWMTLAAVSEGSCVVLHGVGINPRRTAFLDVLRRMGAEIEISNVTSADWEPTATLTVRGHRLRGTHVGGQEIPNLIDEIPILAVAAALADGVTTVADATELRVKESDRIATIATSLTTFGVPVEERPDGLIIRGTRTIVGNGVIDSHGDHRIAMAMSILALFADASVKIDDIACIATSYPSFWEHFESLTQ